MTKAMDEPAQQLRRDSHGVTMSNMKSKAARILEEAMTLPEGERADLAGRLLDSLDPEEAEPGSKEAWAAEVERRVREIDSGRAKLVPWSQVRRNLLRSRRETKRRTVSR